MDRTATSAGFYDGDDGEALDVGAEALGVAMAMHHSCTAQHCEEVASLAREVGERMALDTDDLRTLELAAQLHDIGKIAVPDSILDKSDALTEHEWDVMRRHPAWGAEALRRIGLQSVAPYVRLHHERWDGTGYPDALSGEQIPLLSRILAACDAYGAMTEDRPYRAALKPQQALAELCAGAGEQFDPHVVAVLRSIAEGYPPPKRLGAPEPALAA